jgi:uncharacterized membrane protein (DUF485 family)
MVLHSEEKQQKSPARRFLQLLGVFMFALYFLLGLVLVFWSKFPLQLSTTSRIALGVIIIAYSFFRFYRLIQIRRED